MPTFPRKEEDLVALANAMAVGYTTHSADFPSADKDRLSRALEKYNDVKTTQIDAMVTAQIATERKNLRLDTLELIMRNELRKSEVDAGSDAEKLKRIGWGPNTTPSPIDLPGPPRNLDLVYHSAGTLLLDWKAPARGSGGLAYTYIIQRRCQPSEDNQSDSWEQSGIAPDTEITLTDQPKGIKLEYRVKAVNAGGESPPSNIVAVVL